MSLKGFKGFNKGLVCNGFQYKEGEEFKIDGEIQLCQRGFHFCENPLDVLNYYELTECEFAEVEALGENKKDKNGDTKNVTNHIKIVKKLALKEFIEAAINYVKTVCKSGDSSKLAASGNYSQLAASGDSSKLAASGNYSQLAASGDSSKLAASGNSSQLEMTGKDSVGANIGINGKIKGIKGSWITLAEYDDDYKCICVKSAKIDGKKIKENVWYQLKKGKFVEAR